MNTDRRKIMAALGVMFASVVTLSCRLGQRTPAPTSSCYVIPPFTPTPSLLAAGNVLQPTPDPSTTPPPFVWSQAWANCASSGTKGSISWPSRPAMTSGVRS